MASGRAPIEHDASVTKRRTLPAELSEHFSVGEARRLGVPHDRLGASDLESHFHGSRSVSVPEAGRASFAVLRRDHLRRCREFLTIARPGAHFSHVSAAIIYGMPLPLALAARIEIDISTPRQPPRRGGVIGHRSGGTEQRVVGGLPVVTPEVAWLQLALLLSGRDLVIAGDHLVRAKAPLSTLARLSDSVLTSGGVRGIAAARRALDLVREGTASPPETKLRLLIVEAGLPEPVVGYTVHHDGYWVGTPDLAYVSERIALEYQGEGHRDERTFLEDIDRLERFHDAGWLVIQVTKVHLRDARRLAARIEWHLRSRAQK